MEKYNKRRRFLKTLITVPALSTTGLLSSTQPAHSQDKMTHSNDYKFKISLNAFSFNDPLTKGKMTQDDMLDFCAKHNFDAVDLTAYYFPGYPAVPADEYLYHIKRKAFDLGLDISGTGVRNDFTDPDASKRKKDISLVKNWI